MAISNESFIFTNTLNIQGKGRTNGVSLFWPIPRGPHEDVTTLPVFLLVHDLAKLSFIWDPIYDNNILAIKDMIKADITIIVLSW